MSVLQSGDFRELNTRNNLLAQAGDAFGPHDYSCQLWRDEIVDLIDFAVHRYYEIVNRKSFGGVERADKWLVNQLAGIEMAYDDYMSECGPKAPPVNREA